MVTDAVESRPNVTHAMNTPYFTTEILAEAAQAEQNFGLFEIFHKGGPLMWVLLVFSILAFMAIFVCSWITRSASILPKNMVENVENYIRRKDYAGLQALCERDGSCFALTVKVIILFIQRNAYANMDAIREVAAAEGTRQTNILTRHISWLADIGTVAPMVGLLGTVLGMMKTFSQMAVGDFVGVKQMQMAGGISEAMITTAGGLILAIPCVLSYVVFRSWIQKHIADMEVAVTHVLSVLSAQMDRDRRLGSVAHADARPELIDNMEP